MPESKIRSFKQRIFKTNQFGPENKFQNSFVSLKGETDQSDGGEVAWLRKVVLLFRFDISNRSESLELGFIQYMKCIRPSDNADRILGCIYMRQATDNEID